jgi:urease accessory protein
MRGRISTGIAAAAILVPVTPVNAHAPLDGVGEFYSALLHPIVVPAELLAIAAIGLLLGSCGLKHCRSGVPAMAGGLVLGLAAGVFGGVVGDGGGFLLCVAMAVAAAVTAALRLPVLLAALLSLVCGITIGLDAQPESQSLSSAALTGAATVLSATLLALFIAALALRPAKFWQEVAVRVAGSWITASGMLYFSWRLTA